MKVIFLSDVKSQGKKDEIKEVKDGYARYLISSKLAVPYTAKGMEILKSEMQQKEQEETNHVEEANKLKKELEKVKLEFAVKTGEKDKVFGSISSKVIHEELLKNGFNIDKKKIKIKSELNSLGYHEVEIELYKNVSCIIKVLIKK